MKSMRTKRRTAFTIVELLVVVAIIGVLVALLLPAVQQVRAAARGAQCRNHLRQLGLALHNYHDVHRLFPPRQGGSGTIHDGGHRFRMSGFVALLPYYEQQALFDQIMASPDKPWSDSPWWDHSPAMLRCPADIGTRPPAGPGPRGLLSYALCGGDTPLASVVDSGERTDPVLAAKTLPMPNRGIFGRGACTRIADIIDGTSNTIALSERSRPEQFRDRGMVGMIPDADPDAFDPADCAAMLDGHQYRPDVSVFDYGTSPGYRWGDGAAFFQAFVTVLPPNSASCLIGSALWPEGGGHLGPGVWTAGSRHAGGVYCLFADGSVRFVSDSIDTGPATRGTATGTASGAKSDSGIWGALGTKGSREQ